MKHKSRVDIERVETARDAYTASSRVAVTAAFNIRYEHLEAAHEAANTFSERFREAGRVMGDAAFRVLCRDRVFLETVLAAMDGAARGTVARLALLADDEGGARG